MTDDATAAGQRAAELFLAAVHVCQLELVRASQPTVSRETLGDAGALWSWASADEELGAIARSLRPDVVDRVRTVLAGMLR